MKKSMKRSVMVVALVLFMSQLSFGHCQIPCGIYNDPQRIAIIAEHITTIEKSMNEINKLAKSGENPNQLARWVSNKEEYAVQIQTIVTDYFMTQRIKPGQENYSQKLALLHKMLLLSMKAKQTTSLDVVKDLRTTLSSFEKLYIGHSH